MKEATIKEYGGFVLYKETGEYDLKFVTENSALLAKNRAVERAKNENKFLGKEVYDTRSVKVKTREKRISIGEWQEGE